MIPCHHAIRACDEFGLDPESYINSFYSVENYRRIYDGEQSFLWPIIKDFLSKTKDSCLPPLAVKQKGTRAKKRRTRRSAIERDKVEKERQRQKEIREAGGPHGSIFIFQAQREMAAAISSHSSQAPSQRLHSPRLALSRPISLQAPTSTLRTKDNVDDISDESLDVPSSSPSTTQGGFNSSPSPPALETSKSPRRNRFSRPVSRHDAKEFPAGYIKSFRPLSMIIPPYQRLYHRREKHISLCTLIPRLHVSGDETRPVFQPGSKAPDPDSAGNHLNELQMIPGLNLVGKGKAKTQSKEVESAPSISKRGIDLASPNREEIKELLNDPKAALEILKKDDNPPKGLIRYLESKIEQQNRQQQPLLQPPLPSKRPQPMQLSLGTTPQASQSAPQCQRGPIRARSPISDNPFKEPPSPPPIQPPCKQKAWDISPRKQSNRDVNSSRMRCAVCGSRDHRDYQCPQPHCKFCLVVDHETANCLQTKNTIHIESDTDSTENEYE